MASKQLLIDRRLKPSKGPSGRKPASKAMVIAVYTALVARADNRSSRTEKTSLDLLAELTGMGINGVRDAIAVLTKYGYVETVRQSNGRTTNVYRLLPPPALAAEDQIEVSNRAHCGGLDTKPNDLNRAQGARLEAQPRAGGMVNRAQGARGLEGELEKDDDGGESRVEARVIEVIKLASRRRAQASIERRAGTNRHVRDEKAFIAAAVLNAPSEAAEGDRSRLAAWLTANPDAFGDDNVCLRIWESESSPTADAERTAPQVCERCEEFDGLVWVSESDNAMTRCDHQGRSNASLSASGSV